jgi:hypothetical protein
MKAGFWLHGSRSVEIHDHEQSMRCDRSTAERLGIPAKIVRDAAVKHQCREPFLNALMLATGAVRVRGHLDHTTFEYAAEKDDQPLECIRRFVRNNLCEQSMLKIVNLRVRKERWVRGGDLLTSKRDTT